MANKFILDENQIYAIMTRLNERGMPDNSAAILFFMIENNGHILLLTSNITEKYYHKFGEIENLAVPIMVKFPHIFKLLLHDSDKFQWEDDMPVSFPPNQFDNDDKDFVSLAARFRAYLSTNDNKLITDIRNNGIDSAHHFIIDRPENLTIHAQ